MFQNKIWFVGMVLVGIVGIIGLVDVSLLSKFKYIWILPAVIGMIMSIYYTAKTIPTMFK
jgi:hypothetical protein